MRIVRLANFVTPRSGGLRTALRRIGGGYAAAGHEPVLIVPGDRHREEVTEQGLVISLPGPTVPGTGGYRVLVNRPQVIRLLRDLRPDRLEVSDRTTLRWTGSWARRNDVRAVMVSHESLDGLLRLLGGGRLRLDAAADRLNARTAVAFDRVVCTTGWAAAEFRRIGATNVDQVPLGVDLDRFHPDRRDPRLRARYAAPTDLLLLHCGRLSPEKKPDRSLATIAELRARGVPATLVVAGDGPYRSRLESAARTAGVPAHFLGHVTDSDLLAGLLASADVVLAPGPVETFGLAALEALASGTPVVAAAESALPEVIGDAGLAAHADVDAYADAVLDLAVRPRTDRRDAARRRAERFPWQATVAGFLGAHGVGRFVTAAGAGEGSGPVTPAGQRLPA